MKKNIPFSGGKPLPSQSNQKPNEPGLSDLYKTKKMGTELTTQGHSAQLTPHETCKCSELSEIILNSDQFWRKKVKESDAESLLSHSSSSSKNTVKKRKDGNATDSRPSKNSHSGIQSSAFQLELLSQSKQQSYSSLSLVSNSTAKLYQNKSARKFEKPQKQVSPIKCSKYSQELSNTREESRNRVSINYMFDKVKYLEEMALVGYWCSLYMRESSIQWEGLCILIYKEVKHKLMKIPGLKQSSKGMAKNLQKMIEKYEQSQKGTKRTSQYLQLSAGADLFPLIMKESEKPIKGLMKRDQYQKTSQFCLFKISQAVNMAALINGYLEASLDLQNLFTEEFSLEALKQNLKIYRNLSQAKH